MSDSRSTSTHLQPLLAALQSLTERLDALLARDPSAFDGVAAPDWSASNAFKVRRRGERLTIDPVRHVATMPLSALQAVDVQRERIVRNTEQFVSGRPANNVLLTGARGTGKSSLIKACLNAFAHRGLRLIEIDKTDLVDLPMLVDVLADRRERFVLFCDDLSFEEGDAGYKALKSALDGSIARPSDNLLIYATSNRRHLLPESMRDNLAAKHTDDGEIHPGEVVEEKISLSERFGLWISFYPFTQAEYLAIVAQWLQHFGVTPTAIDHATPQALVWALERGSRSGRVAYQFARDFAGQQG
jgi:uncharacterized protein